jgi:MoxR-like ATPase
MKALYPSSPSKSKPLQPMDLPAHPVPMMRRPENYLPDPGLVDAINVALMLRQPLMVTGEPGTGKTVMAWSVAWELGLEAPLVFETKSTSQARDLFYLYDAIGRFSAKEFGADTGNAKNYITFNALGAAIILTNAPEAVADVLPVGFKHPGKRRSVVLIDEVEKAPRDFPNDMLNELERMYFRIPELANRRIDADEAFSPIVIMTNNSEKSLPDPFLRRCIYYNISFPEKLRLEQIVIARLPEFAEANAVGALSRDAIDFLLYIRQERASLEKRPGTAELLNWLTAITKLGGKPAVTLREQIEFGKRTLCALTKISDDQARARELLENWRDERSSN